jgi:ABC-type bacteriocin/lantibiotic exporter with double-glycine peptidase domain
VYPYSWLQQRADPPGPSGLWGLSSLVLTSVPAFYITKYQYKIFEKRLAVSDKKISLMQECIQAISMVKFMAAERFWFKRIKTVQDEEFMRLTQARLLGFLSGLL